MRSAGLFDAGGATVENVGVDLRGADVTVSQELLDGADIVACLEQVRREGVAKGVRACALGDPGEPHGIPDRTLQDRLVEMVAAVLPGTLVDADPSRREHPLPGHSRPAFGYLRARAHGSSTQPA